MARAFHPPIIGRMIVTAKIGHDKVITYSCARNDYEMWADEIIEMINTPEVISFEIELV